MSKDKRHTALCRMTLNTLLALGYKPYYFDSTQSQIDCIVDGVCFAVYHDPFSDTVGYGCVFEPSTAPSAEQLAHLEATLQAENTPFQRLIYAAEDGTVHLESEVSVTALTPQLLERIVAAIKKKNGALEQIKSISYQWEEL